MLANEISFHVNSNEVVNCRVFNIKEKTYLLVKIKGPNIKDIILIQLRKLKVLLIVFEKKNIRFEHDNHWTKGS